jgi:hypothetical protein
MNKNEVENEKASQLSSLRYLFKTHISEGTVIFCIPPIAYAMAYLFESHYLGLHKISNEVIEIGIKETVIASLYLLGFVIPATIVYHNISGIISVISHYKPMSTLILKISKRTKIFFAVSTVTLILIICISIFTLDIMVHIFQEIHLVAWLMIAPFLSLFIDFYFKRDLEKTLLLYFIVEWFLLLSYVYAQANLFPILSSEMAFYDKKNYMSISGTKFILVRVYNDKYIFQEYNQIENAFNPTTKILDPGEMAKINLQGISIEKFK